MAKKIISIVVILALVFAGGYFTCMNILPDASETNAEPTYATKPVTKGDLKVGINISGQLNANWGGSVSAPKLEGIPKLEDIDNTIKYVVEEVFVNENDEVKMGDPVVRLSASNLGEIIEKSNSALAEKYDAINEALKTLGMKINKDITDISQVNPYDGIVYSAPISGRVTELQVEEGEKIKETSIANIINDSKFKIKFKCTVNEFPTLYSGQKILLNYSGYEGYYEGTIKNINKNPVPNEDKISYVHNGVIEATNPGLIQPGTTVGISIDNNGTPGATLTYAGTVDSYSDQSKIFITGFDVSGKETYLATEVFVSENEFVEKGQSIVRIAGNDVTESIQTDIDAIKVKMKEAEELQKGIANIMEFSDKLMVTAPRDGIVSWKRYNVGDTFEGSAQSDQWSLEVLNLYDSNQMSISTQVSDLDVNYVQQGAKVDVTVDALPDKTFEGTVERLYQYDEKGKVIYSVEISVVGGEGLRPGMNTNCFIDAGESLDTLLIPIEAVFEEDYKQKVEVLNEDGTVSAVEIEIGLMNDRFVEVLSGLEEGQNVVTGNLEDLMPSQKVDSDKSLLPNNKK